MSPTTSTKKGTDVHGRTEEQQEADRLFTEDVAKITAQRGRFTTLPQTRFGASHKGAFLTIKRVKAGQTVEEKVPLEPAVYDLQKLQALAVELGKNKTDAATITTRLRAEASLNQGICVSTESESRIGSKSIVNIAPLPEGFVAVPNIEMPILGTPVVLKENGSFAFGSFVGGAKEYEKWLPVIQSQWIAHNTWCQDLPSERVLYMADQVDEALAMLEKQIANLHGVSIYTIAPRWLRYFSDGNMHTQKSNGFGLLRNAPMATGGMRPLLYDGPAWVVGLRMGKKMVPGRVFVTPEGKFIGSDWCQREVDKNGGIDLHTGEFTKHTLMSWCAGPGISRFGDVEIKNRHGELRRPILKTAGADPKKVAARKKLAQLLITVYRKSSLRAGKMVDDDMTQVASLRFVRFEPDWDSNPEYNEMKLIGFTARFGKYVHDYVMPVDSRDIVAPHMAEFNRKPGTILGVSKAYLTETTEGVDTFAITDDEMAQEIVNTMKEAF